MSRWHATRTEIDLGNLNETEIVMTNPIKPQRNQAENKPIERQPKKQDGTRKHAPNQGPDYSAPGRTDRTDGGGRNRPNEKIQSLPKVVQK